MSINAQWYGIIRGSRWKPELGKYLRIQKLPSVYSSLSKWVNILTLIETGLSLLGEMVAIREREKTGTCPMVLNWNWKE